jgi:hypothetical protein
MNVIKDENANLLADPESLVNRWKHFFNQALNIYWVHDFRQIDIHTAEPLVPETSLFKMKTEKL